MKITIDTKLQTWNEIINQNRRNKYMANKIKQDEIDTDNNTVMYYLPVSYPTRCSDCLLNKNGIKDIKNKKGNK